MFCARERAAITTLDTHIWHSKISTAKFILISLPFPSVSMTSVPKLAVSIQPLGDRIVVLPLEAQQVTASGIVIPDTAKEEKPHEGVVLALGKGGIGKDCVNPHEYLKVGDKVLFKKYGPDEIEVDGKKYLVGDEEDILAIIE